MVPITALWLPILLSAVIVFVASSILHMVIPIHKSDYRILPDEDKVSDALRSAGVTPGPMYHFPHTTMKDMKSPATIEKFKRGPVGFIIIRPSGPPGFVKNLVQWFVYSIVVSIFAAYLTGRTHSSGANYLEVFRVAGCAALWPTVLANCRIRSGKARPGRDHQARDRRPDLRPAHRRNVWLALAKIVAGG